MKMPLYLTSVTCSLVSIIWSYEPQLHTISTSFRLEKVRHLMYIKFNISTGQQITVEKRKCKAAMNLYKMLDVHFPALFLYRLVAILCVGC